MSDEIVAVIEGRFFTEQELYEALREYGIPESDINSIRPVIGMRRDRGRLPVVIDDLPLTLPE